MKKNLLFYWIIAVLTLGGGLLAGGCSDADKAVTELVPAEHNLVIVLIDESYRLDYASSMKIRGLHFAQGDAIFFKQAEQAVASDEEFPVTVRELTSTDITVVITPEIVTGRWSLYCRRGDQTQLLGTTQLDVDILRLVRDVELEARYTLDKGDRMVIPGAGFASGDKIFFAQPENKAAERYYAAVTVIDDRSITFNIPDQLSSGDWSVGCQRGEDTQVMGVSTLTITRFPFIDPAQLAEGTNAYGRVYCGDEPLSNVCVSDGVEVVQTDAMGVYSMSSARANGTLFVSLPAGYEAAVEGCIPQFYHLFEADRMRYDFPLVKADQSSYVLLVTADIQIDNDLRKVVPQSSLKSCEQTFVPAYKNTVAEYAGRKIYSVSLGDMVYDKFWYSRHFGIPEYKELIRGFGVPFFHIMGNHDNDPYCADDFQAEHAFRELLAPTYYSINIGGVHYIALDNIRYINTGASKGVVGQTNYVAEVSARQIAWLKKDLAAVAKSTPVMVWMHAPLVNVRTYPISTSSPLANAEAVASCFDGYTVRVLSGHWHTNHTGVYPGRPNIEEHNVGSVCGALWHNIPGFNGQDQPFGAATDGTPQGFAVYEVNGTDIRWQFRPCDAGADVQFTAYDMNRQTYKDKSVANEILVNVWNWDEAWTVEIREGSQPLPVTREAREDPNYKRFLATAYAESGEGPKGSTTPLKTPHMFSAITAAADSPVQVVVTDRFGRVYSKQLRL